MSILVSAARYLSIRLHASKTPTGFVPLSKVHTAVVFVDADEPGVQALIDSVVKYFSSKGIKAGVFAVSAAKVPEQLKGAVVLGRRNVGWYGKPRRHGRRAVKTDLGEELFVNLFGRYNFTAEFCASASNASFKVARSHSSKGVYNMLVTSEGFDQNSVFTQMAGLLDTVK
jgi:hypothetical protein